MYKKIASATLILTLFPNVHTNGAALSAADMEAKKVCSNGSIRLLWPTLESKNSLGCHILLTQRTYSTHDRNYHNQNSSDAEFRDSNETLEELNPRTTNFGDLSKTKIKRASENKRNLSPAYTTLTGYKTITYLKP